jgi:hypothetical protein
MSTSFQKLTRDKSGRLGSVTSDNGSPTVVVGENGELCGVLDDTPKTRAKGKDSAPDTSAAPAFGMLGWSH